MISAEGAKVANRRQEVLTLTYIKCELLYRSFFSKFNFSFSSISITFTFFFFFFQNKIEHFLRHSWLFTEGLLIFLHECICLNPPLHHILPGPSLPSQNVSLISMNFLLLIFIVWGWYQVGTFFLIVFFCFFFTTATLHCCASPTGSNVSQFLHSKHL